MLLVVLPLLCGILWNIFAALCGAGFLPDCRSKGSKLSRVLSCANLLDFHAEIQVRANAAKSSTGWGLSWVGQLRELVEAPEMLALAANALLEAALAGQCPRSSQKALGNSVSWSLQSFLAPAVCIFQERGQAKASSGLVSGFYFLNLRYST